MKNLILRTLKIQDKPLVAKHLEHCFYKTAPLVQGTKWCNPTGDYKEMNELEMSHIDQGYSHGFFNENGEIASIFINSLELKNVKKPPLKFTNLQNQLAFGFLQQQWAKVDFFEKFNVDKMFLVHLISTDPRYQHLGLARRLNAELERVARSLGVRAIRGDTLTTFGHASQVAFNYKIAFESYLKDHVDGNGEMILKNIPTDIMHKLVYKIVDA